MSRRILYIQFTDPAAYPPIEHSSGLFAERGWEVFMVGMDSAGALNLKLPVHPRMQVKNLGSSKADGDKSFSTSASCFLFYIGPGGGDHRGSMRPRHLVVLLYG